MPRQTRQAGKWSRLGRRLRELRGRLSQEEVGKLVGISPGYVSNLESGRYQAQTDVLEQYADKLGGDYNELAEMAGLLRRRPDYEWTPPADVVADLRALVERLTFSQVKRGVRTLLDLYDESAERDKPDIPRESQRGEKRVE